MRPPSRRSRGRGDAHDASRSRLGGVAEADGKEAARGGLAGRGQRRRVALALQLAERDESLELTAGAPVELAERAIEGGVGRDGDDEDIRAAHPTADR